ncbi:MAG: hypothetical protein AVDCRST_MAG49-3633 [uncultured Thermomicrobiales bacterium]|uniref:Uncharacterized protein n=1 Tax=uncultured Thermomicrobiales bacterium TaxID=1645740 RepID=A0A6J4V7G9_9BACT|nr:MAG: hypothetical protein AVDCRST_MAG49-3633 [uncultured Thermomicrobiales bacterium]
MLRRSGGRLGRLGRRPRPDLPRGCDAADGRAMPSLARSGSPIRPAET